MRPRAGNHRVLRPGGQGLSAFSWPEDESGSHALLTVITRLPPHPVGIRSSLCQERVMDPQDLPSGRRLPGPGEPAPQEARARSRDRGLRQVRRLSSWTAVALVAATAATAGYFARAHPATQPPVPVAGV